jgi:O-6-methylguanine DNA methyltransferase
VRAQFTQYAVPGWGVGELWTGEGRLLTHEFRFGAVDDGADDEDARYGNGSRTSRGRGWEASPPTGERGSLAGTVSGISARVGDGFVPGSQQPSPVRSRAPTAAAAAPNVAVAPGGIDPHGLVERFRAFFAGKDVTFDDVPVDLEWATPFQHAVATALRAVPRGEIVSYGELAALAGFPGAARAAGSFCAHNRYMLVVPCHRVVGASGLGGYGSAGVETKRRLLALEGVAV